VRQGRARHICVLHTVTRQVYFWNGHADLTSAALIAVPAIAMTPLGARATKSLDCAALRRLLAYWLFFVAPLVGLLRQSVPMENLDRWLSARCLLAW
jgi:uncharacterized membrane protein YfcA